MSQVERRKAIYRTRTSRNLSCKNDFATRCHAFDQIVKYGRKNRDFYAPFLPKNLYNFRVFSRPEPSIKRATKAVQPVW